MNKEDTLPHNDHGEEEVWDCGSPLYDSYELVSLTHVIERNIMLLPFSVIRSSKKFTISSRISSAKDLVADKDVGSASMIRENSFKVSSSVLLSEHAMRKIIKKKTRREKVLKKILSYISCGILHNYRMLVRK
ncbi:hypothetical protein MKW94_009246 [Papaver nudicaule]|uniref:Uncharacterized protein n=1 Tax=Papaver nudicaule TaxID=74823 RepID=A0AA41SLC3_PAPNU|nr:hypothetical protein [Papaver nudicaule]